MHWLLNPAIFFTALFAARAVCFTSLELLRPARRVEYSAVVWSDLAAYAAFAFLVTPGAAYLNAFFPGHHSFPEGVSQWPFALRFMLYFLLADFGRYWIHRLQHTRYFWQTHKWHHSPTYMYWLSGVRGTLPQQFLINIPYLLAAPLLDISPWWTNLALGAVFTVFNDWMHLNVSWKLRRLEWIFVTPRYHHIHHSNDPRHHNANLASFFTLWDRLFGTYVDPEKLDSQLQFGIGETGDPARLMLGI